MVIEVERTYNKRQIDKILRQITPQKMFDANRFAGQVAWDEDPLEYQKRIRNEWNQITFYLDIPLVTFDNDFRNIEELRLILLKI